MGFMDIVKSVAPFVPVVGPAIGAVAGLLGSKQTNSAQDARQGDAQDFNSGEARINREWSSNEAAITRDYQERLSNSAYQRATTDMRAAGINPMLAYAQGGASVPVGATGASSAASAPSPQPVQNVAEGASRGAQAMMASAQQYAQIENIQANTQSANAQTERTRVETRILEDEGIYEADYGRPYTDEHGKTRYEIRRDDEGKPIKRGHLYSRNEKTRIETIMARETAQLRHWERNLVVEEVENAIAENRRIIANTDNIKADTVLKRLRAEGEEGASSKFWKANPDFYGVREGVKTGSEAVNSAVNAISKGLQYTPAGRAGRGLKLLRR